MPLRGILRILLQYHNSKASQETTCMLKKTNDCLVCYWTQFTCPWCTVRSNWNTGVWSRERFAARTKQGEQAVHAQMVWTTWMAFRQGFVRTMLGEKVSGYMISSRPFWLVGGEITGWYFWNLNLLIPTSLGSACSWSACSHHPPPEWGSWFL